VLAALRATFNTDRPGNQLRPLRDREAA
jgi:hypothetical protein